MIRVMLGESDASTAELLTMALKVSGFDVMRSASGLEVLELARVHHPDLILANVQLARLGGCEVCKVVRSDQQLRQTKVVLFGSLDEGDVLWRQAGADTFLQKPISVRTLPQVLRAVLGVTSPGKDTPTYPDEGILTVE
jgi:DNA-binding response OmpR family regulator